MESSAKTPVEIVQEIIAIHATRKEAVSRFAARIPGMDPAKLIEESDRAITQLMGELSHFGDGVNSEADRDNDYQHRYKQSLGVIDQLGEEEAQATFRDLENSLRNVYTQTLQSSAELPESLVRLLEKQQSMIS